MSVVLAALTGALAMAPAAGAWTLPSNAGAAPGSSVASYCVGRNDTLQVLASGTTGATGAIASGWQGGTAELYVQAGSSDSISADVNLGGGADVAFQVLPARTSATSYSGSVDLPAAASSITINVNGASGLSSWALVGSPAANSAAELDEIACLNAAAAAGQAHSDSGALLTELQTLDADVRSSGGGSGTGVVELSPADRQLLADASNGAHDDLWLFGGALLGVWLLWTLVKAVWL